jgi:hypothetical protein
MQRTQRGEADKAPPRTKRPLQRSDAPPAIVSEMIPYGKLYPAKQPKHANGTTAKTSPADKQLVQVINLLMSHAQQWDEKHWQAFLEVVQNLRGSKEAPTSAISQTSGQ